jgi:hypothetical protein
VGCLFKDRCRRFYSFIVLGVQEAKKRAGLGIHLVGALTRSGRVVQVVLLNGWLTGGTRAKQNYRPVQRLTKLKTDS